VGGIGEGSGTRTYPPGELIWPRSGLPWAGGALLIFALAGTGSGGCSSISPLQASALAYTPPLFDVQGHRGARGLLPENTLAAFAWVLEHGVPTLELDTVVSADGEVVVSHEPWMSAEICAHPDGRPVCPEEAETLNIFRMLYAEVARYDCGRRGHPRFPRQRPEPAAKPRLREVFDLAEGYAREGSLPPVQYNVETKSRPEWDGERTPSPERFVDLLWREVEAAGVAERFILQSFDVRTLQEARRRALPVRLALLVEASAMGDDPPDPMALLDAGLTALGFVPDIYSPDYRLVTPAVIAHAHGLGARIIPWTVNDANVMLQLKALGVDGLITDYPDLALPLAEAARQ
jgi:glycerophosphoryl diester phosphodiesterase